jgi:hypothetical protein
MSLLMSVHTHADIPIRLYSSQEAALADKDNWKRAEMDAPSRFIGFRLVGFNDGVPSMSDLLVET